MDASLKEEKEDETNEEEETDDPDKQSEFPKSNSRTGQSWKQKKRNLPTRAAWEPWNLTTRAGFGKLPLPYARTVGQTQR